MKELLNEFKVIVFELNYHAYAIGISSVRSIEKAQAITRVPFTPPYIKGIIYLRGEIIPILDLREKLRIIPKHELTNQTRIILVSISESVVGLLVDAVTDVYTLDPNSIKAAPAKNEFLQAQWVKGISIIDSQLVTVLDIEKMIESDISQHRNEGGKNVVH